MKQPIRLGHCILFLGLLPGVIGSSGQGCIVVRTPACPTEPGDNWYAAPPPGAIGNAEALPAERIQVLDAAHIAEAEAMLASAAAVSLDLATASRLLGRELPAIQGTTPFLVRALAQEGYISDSSRFDVHFNEGTLSITYPTLGRCDLSVPTQRAPLVVFLPSAPNVVYIEIAALPI